MILQLDFESDVPIYLQLRHQIVMGISSGALALGESLPSVRQLAQEAGINAMTVNKAYQLLKQEGFLIIDRRHGAKVNTQIPRVHTYIEHLEKHLERWIAEASLRGVNEQDFCKIVSKLYQALPDPQKN